MWRLKASALLLRSACQWRIHRVTPQAPILVPPSIASKTPWRSLPVSSHVPYLRSFSFSPEFAAQVDHSTKPSSELNETRGSESAGGESSSDLCAKVVQTGHSETIIKPVAEDEEFDIDEEVERVKESLDCAICVEMCFLKLWFHINEEVLSRVLKDSSNFSPEKLFEFFEIISVLYPSSVTKQTVSLFVHAIIGSGEVSETNVYKLWDLIKKLGAEREKGLVGTESLNKLLSVLSKLEKGKTTLEVFEKFDDFACARDADSYYFTIKALNSNNEFKCAWAVCEKMLDSGKLPNGEKTGKIVSIFCRGQMGKEAHLVYLMAKEKRLTVSASVLDVLVGSLSRCDEAAKDALEILDEYKGDALRNVSYIFGLVLQGLCKAREVKEAKKLLLRMVESGPQPGNAAFNYVITALSREGDMKEAIKLMELMENRGIRPDIYTYTVIMSGYAKCGMMKEAHDLLHEVKKSYEKLPPVCYHIIIRGYCKREQFDKAIECLTEMKEYGIEPYLDEYNKLIQSFSLKAIDWRRAEDLLMEMGSNRLPLPGMTQSLISAVKEIEEDVGVMS